MNGVTQVSAHTFEIGGMGAAIPQEAPQPGPVRQTPARSVPAVTTEEPLTAASLLRQLKQRRRVVRAELKHKKRLETELAQIERLIRAATTELDNVRRLRAAG